MHRPKSITQEVNDSIEREQLKNTELLRSMQQNRQQRELERRLQELEQRLRGPQPEVTPAPKPPKRTRNRETPVQDRILWLAQEHNVSASNPQELLDGVEPHWGAADRKKFGGLPTWKTFKCAFVKFQKLPKPYSP
jgi:hypothetical protein